MTGNDITAEASRLARGLADTLEPTFERIERIAATAASTRPSRGGTWSEGDLLPAQRQILKLIAEDDLLVGMGFVAAPLMVDSQERYMMWWQRNDGRTSRLKLNFDRSSIDVYDYVEMEWFQLPQGGRARVATGPYVDYSGSELYIVTAAVPVLFDDGFLGIAGADLLFGELERRLVDGLRKASAEAVIVTSERRVVAANSPRWVHGAKLPSLPAIGAHTEGAVWQAVEALPGGTGWLLAVTDAQIGRMNIS